MMRTFQADLIQRKYHSILQEFDDPEKGHLDYRKDPNGIYLKKEIDEPGKTILLVTPHEFLVYYPKKNQAIRRKIDENMARYANIGIGTSVEDLKKNFAIDYVKDEAQGNKVYHVLDLHPIKASIKEYFNTLSLWIDSQNGVPVRQRILEDNGDYTDIQFLDIKINKKIKDKTFELKLPKNVEFIN
jgi:outer membrane lipoprotein-sorting protein